MRKHLHGAIGRIGDPLFYRWRRFLLGKSGGQV